MCGKKSICPEYERRISEGITSACEMCEYIKQERKHLKKVRITAAIMFIAFVISTYLKFN